MNFVLANARGVSHLFVFQVPLYPPPCSISVHFTAPVNLRVATLGPPRPRFGARVSAASAKKLEEIALVALRDTCLTAKRWNILERAVGFARSSQKRMPKTSET